jgi:hypothetical protein
MPRSSRFASLAFGAFYFTVPFLTFYEFIRFGNEKMKGMEWGVACLSIPLIQSSPLR